MSFEYRSVSLTRPWLRAAIFGSRFWRLPDGAGILSDGTGGGRCPAFAAALVFGRRVVVRYKEATGGSPEVELPIRTFKVAPAAFAPKYVQMMVAQPPSEAMGASSVSSPLLLTKASHATIALKSAAFAKSELPLATLVARAPSAKPFMVARAWDSRTIGMVADHVSVADVRSPEPSPQVDPPAPAGTDEVLILAFICKRIGRCPDPDSGLSWD
jgi:hypothetical protein